MLDVDQLQNNIDALNNGDDPSRRRAIRALHHVEQQEWTTAPTALLRPLVLSLQRQLLSDITRPLIHREVATILGNMGQRSKSAVPQLIQLLREEIPDAVRETAANALGKLGGEARAAVEQLIMLSNGPTALALQAVRAFRRGWLRR